MYVKFLESGDFKNKLKRSVKSLNNIPHNSDDFMIYDKNKFTSSLVQKYIFLKKDQIHDRIIKPILLNASMRAELTAAGAGDLCLQVCSLMLIDHLSRNNVKIQDDFINRISTYSKKLSREDYLRLIDVSMSNDLQKKVLSTVMDNINVSTPIFLKRSNTVKTQIIIDSGFRFDISVDKKFLTSRTKKMRDVGCFVIDGFIESVSEIHHLLEKAASDKKPYIMFARHMSKDVESTIAYNVQRGSLNLVPVAVGFDQNTINILNDISICTNSDLISSHKGDLISKSVQKDPALVDLIEIGEGSINILNKKPSHMIKNHLKYLADKKECAKDITLIDMIDRRINALSSGKLSILIGTDMMSKDPQTIERIDRFLRQSRSLIRSGVIYHDDISGHNKYLDKSMLQDYPYSTLSIIIAMKNATSVFNSLKNIDGVIYEDVKFN